MRHLIAANPVVVTLLICVFFFNCRKSGSNTQAGLPPETQTGQNTFGCMVNGKIFVPKGGGISANYSCFYQQAYAGFNGYFFHVSGDDKSNSEVVSSVGISCDSIKLAENQTYSLINVLKGNSAGDYIVVSSFTTPATTQYTTTATLTGEMTIKRFDETRHIVAGTFWFNAVSSKGDTVKITEGRFDMLYSQ